MLTTVRTLLTGATTRTHNMVPSFLSVLTGATTLPHKTVSPSLSLLTGATTLPHKMVSPSLSLLTRAKTLPHKTVFSSLSLLTRATTRTRQGIRKIRRLVTSPFMANSTPRNKMVSSSLSGTSRISNRLRTTRMLSSLWKSSSSLEMWLAASLRPMASIGCSTRRRIPVGRQTGCTVLTQWAASHRLL